jgi:hypothetical protein
MGKREGWIGVRGIGGEYGEGSLIGLDVELVLDEEEGGVEVVEAPGVAVLLLRGHWGAVVAEADAVAEYPQVHCVLHLLQSLQLEDLFSCV